MAIKTLRGAQKAMKDFAVSNNWEDYPNIDKFDHVHEELIGMSQHLRYKTRAEMEEIIKDKHEIFLDGIGDTLLALSRLSNQLGVDMENAFNHSIKELYKKYGNETGKEVNILNPDNSIT